MYIKKNDDNTWEVRFYYVDYTGKRRQKHKSKFPTKRAAEKWATEYKLKEHNKVEMTFRSFWDIYRADMNSRLRKNTMITKEYIVELKILPFFGQKKLCDITTADIRRWQQSLLQESGYSQTYIKTIYNQLKAIFNYAVKYYELQKNPCDLAGTIGKSKAEEMEYWNLEEFDLFLASIKDPIFYYAFLTLFWTGIRLGELLALQLKDLDIENKTLNINKSCQRIKGEDVITNPKTENSKRVITIPDFLAEELQEYINKLYGFLPEDRLFIVTKSNLEKVMSKAISDAGVKKIRIHDLRHSHATLLINALEVQPQLVAKRLGHSNISTTLTTYSHLFPNQNRELAEKLNALHINTGKGDD